MIYLENSTEPQTLSIPREGYDEVIAQKIWKYRPQEKVITIERDGIYDITPDEGYTALSKVTIKVNHSSK